MTHQEFTALLKNPQSITTDKVLHLKELLDLYPYFVPARMLYLRALRQSENILFDDALNQAALYAHNRAWLYYFVYPEKKANKQKYIRSEKNSGDYFGMLEAVEQDGKDVNQSLKILAERLKQARLDVLSGLEAKQEEKIETKIPQPISLTSEDCEEKAKLLIREKKYVEALAILKGLNLNNPKKSVYFADQIRFLEKIIDNIKKQ